MNRLLRRAAPTQSQIFVEAGAGPGALCKALGQADARKTVVLDFAGQHRHWSALSRRRRLCGWISSKVIRCFVARLPVLSSAAHFLDDFSLGVDLLSICTFCSRVGCPFVGFLPHGTVEKFSPYLSTILSSPDARAYGNEDLDWFIVGYRLGSAPPLRDLLAPTASTHPSISDQLATAVAHWIIGGTSRLEMERLAPWFSV